MTNLKPIIALIFSITLLSCSNDDDTNEIIVNNPINYTFERDGNSTVAFSGQSTRIGMATELIDAMKDFDQNTSVLLEMYANQTAAGDDANPYSDAELNASTKSVKSKVAASADFFASNTSESATIKADFESWISAQVTEVFPNQNELAEAGKAGQLADGTSARYVNAKGLEYNQAVNKSLIGALMVDQILNNYLSTAVLDAGTNKSDNDEGITEENQSYTTMEHKWDEAYGYLFGASANTSNPLISLGDDNFLNKYLARVDADEDFNGIAQIIFDAFKLGRAAIVAKEYGLRDEQIKILKENISKLIAIRAVYYLQQGKLALADQNFGAAFHDLSEGFGFVYSLRFLRESTGPNPYFSKSEVDAMINLLMEGNGFWDLNNTTLDQLSASIAEKFDFTINQAGE